jgi:Antibiotic biosynthesis monooxygenase
VHFFQVGSIELRKGQAMYASVRQYTINPGQTRVGEATRDVQGGLGPIISEVPGFVAYYVLDAGNNTVVAISIFENRAAAETADQMASDWIRQYMTTAALASSPPRIAAGEVIAHHTK